MQLLSGWENINFQQWRTISREGAFRLFPEIFDIKRDSNFRKPLGAREILLQGYLRSYLISCWEKCRALILIKKFIPECNNYHFRVGLKIFDGINWRYKICPI